MPDQEVISQGWDEFAPWFAQRWEPGQHVAVVAPTGAGKTGLIVALLRLRRWVAAVDAKGGDKTLRTLTKHGYKRVIKWPPPRRELDDKLEERQPVRLIVGYDRPTREQLPKHRQVIADCLGYAFDAGGWTVALDELQMTADRRLMGLGAQIETLLILARDRGVSVVSAYQRPANVPPSASEMSTWFVVGYTRDADTVATLGAEAGQSRAAMRGAVKALGSQPHALLVFSRSPYDPIIVTRAPPPR